MSNDHREHDELARRRFLGAVAAGGVAAIGTSGCSALVLQRTLEQVGSEELALFVERLERGLAAIVALILHFVARARRSRNRFGSVRSSVQL